MPVTSLQQSCVQVIQNNQDLRDEIKQNYPAMTRIVWGIIACSTNEACTPEEYRKASQLAVKYLQDGAHKVNFAGKDELYQIMKNALFRHIMLKNQETLVGIGQEDKEAQKLKLWHFYSAFQNIDDVSDKMFRERAFLNIEIWGQEHVTHSTDPVLNQLMIKKLKEKRIQLQREQTELCLPRDQLEERNSALYRLVLQKEDQYVQEALKAIEGSELLLAS